MTLKISSNLIKRFRIKKSKKETTEASQVVSQKPAGQNSSAVGFGKAAGELVNLKKELTKDVLDKEMAGKILAVQGLGSAEAVFCANALGIAGIILARKLTDEERKIRDKVAGKVSLVFLASDGFQFKDMIGKKVIVEGENGELKVQS